MLFKSLKKKEATNFATLITKTYRIDNKDTTPYKEGTKNKKTEMKK